MKPGSYIAHVRKSDGEIQQVDAHLIETAELTKQFTSTLGLGLSGRLIGLCHDLGKYSGDFQSYIRAVTGLDGEDAKDLAKKLKGTIDHATAGSQLIWNSMCNGGQLSRIVGQILSVSVMSHHSRSGMKDFLSLEGDSPFLLRLAKPTDVTHLEEVLKNGSPIILSEINDILRSPELIDEFKTLAKEFQNGFRGKTTRFFAYNLLGRFIFSCLLDADRINTSNFENSMVSSFRATGVVPNWQKLSDRLETHLSTIKTTDAIDVIRNQISDECFEAASKSPKLFTLTVPTGGGKTLASLRFALRRAVQNLGTPIERIIFVIPYTSIIDQNAREVRKILGGENVLEHHSNLAPEHDTWRGKVLSENWDAPVVFTTSVQFLDSLFAKGTRTARRMHQLANSVIIFDEIQTLPIKTIHAFNNSINFLTTYTNTTAVLCTATMPLLDKVDPNLGALSLSNENEIISNKLELFRALKRTEIVDKRKDSGWNNEEVKEFALDCLENYESVLLVCNTKKSAQLLFESLKRDSPVSEIIHLSTNMCPAHRKSKINKLFVNLSPEKRTPTICVSTQLIEAGIDLDFGCVIRSLAGLDSIIQAGGRCNRHNHRDIGNVYVLNLSEESLGPGLAEISEAQSVSDRVLDEFRDSPDLLGGDLLSQAALDRYYEYFFFKRAQEMVYQMKAGTGTPTIPLDTSLLSLLSENKAATEPAKRKNSIETLNLPLHHAFSTAAQAFQVIDAPTQGIIVPYDSDEHEGAHLIGDLTAALTNPNCPLSAQIKLLKKAQQYTVNSFPNHIKALANENAIREIYPNAGIYCLDERHYDDELGVTIEGKSGQIFYDLNG
ncbi:MAG: CRISPR-associated helicase Cas3' [Verrucomicrobiales bacterium]|nr:CRISPR-associated helicase Cas3' [Verrucomicrobiales bacterium]